MAADPPRSTFAAAAAARGVLGGAAGRLARRSVPLASRVATAAPDPPLARESYRTLAEFYDVRTLAGQPYRRQAVRRLGASRGETILDIGCGTGLNFAQLEAAVGPSGRLVGVDASAQMLAQARPRTERHGWSNVDLVVGTAEDAEIPTSRADAALICGVHDVMRSRSALANVLRHLRDGGRVVAAGPKWVPWWRPGSVALNLFTWTLNRDYVSTFDGFDRPWSHLADLVGDLHIEEVYAGGGYIATGAW
jgi:demethylmenaquinone methyltransferase/2-methoxy-6-polyprenyl-1,4-benzoquinol methylase